jgi:hypothetical protein
MMTCAAPQPSFEEGGCGVTPCGVVAPMISLG